MLLIVEPTAIIQAKVMSNFFNASSFIQSIPMLITDNLGRDYVK